MNFDNLIWEPGNLDGLTVQSDCSIALYVFLSIRLQSILSKSHPNVKGRDFL